MSARLTATMKIIIIFLCLSYVACSSPWDDMGVTCQPDDVLIDVQDEKGCKNLGKYSIFFLITVLLLKLCASHTFSNVSLYSTSDDKFSCYKNSQPQASEETELTVGFL